MASAEELAALARARERRMDAGQLSRAVEGGTAPWASEFARSLDAAKPFDALEEVFAHKVAELQADAMGKADAMVRRITRDVEERSGREAKLSLQAALKEAEQARAHAEAAVMAATARADAEVAEVRCQAKRTIAELRLKVKEASEDAKRAEAELRQERIRAHAERRAHYSERAELEGEVARLRAELAAMSSRLAEDRMHISYAGIKEKKSF
ncbi:hypothetical protein AB1Y20_000752 [Prymnesium parvum]|uniref:Uncharacterized protein n=1 Tax=Prymnesium parvum TaxID=97485 RepID=A0AB34K6R7_PRYPA